MLMNSVCVWQALTLDRITEKRAMLKFVERILRNFQKVKYGTRNSVGRSRYADSSKNSTDTKGILERFEQI